MFALSLLYHNNCIIVALSIQIRIKYLTCDSFKNDLCFCVYKVLRLYLYWKVAQFAINGALFHKLILKECQLHLYTVVDIHSYL